MKSSITRRDFLKLAGLFSLGSMLPYAADQLNLTSQTFQSQNVLVVVFDAWSANHISLYGYERDTTPHLAQLAEKAIVYHNHISGGNFTTPGTASMLTGTLPWTHRALKLSGKVAPAFVGKNMFRAFQNTHRLAYSHNPLAYILLNQFSSDIDDLVPWEALYLESDLWVDALFRADADIATLSWSRIIKQLQGYSYSLFLSHVYSGLKKRKADAIQDIASHFPLGLPNHDNYTYFILEQAIDYLAERVDSAQQPYIGYYHFFPPHDPYHTRDDFFERFAHDDYRPPAKPTHLFKSDKPDYLLPVSRNQYDEFILYVDAEFARLYNMLDQKGILENTWLVLTSDHGEMFERGILGHITPVLYQPIIHVPLLIFPPGLKERIDIVENTSAIDLLTTLAQITNQPSPDWSEGVVLPPFSTSTTDQDVFSFHGDTKNGQIYKGTASILRGNEKLIWYFGYEELGERGEMIELYDLHADPEELVDLYPSRKNSAEDLLSVLREKISKANLT
jgi:arylsulfatase A-like enzyme